MNWERILATGGRLRVSGRQVLLSCRRSGKTTDDVADISWWSSPRIVQFLRANAIGGFDSRDVEMLMERLKERIVPAYAALGVDGTVLQQDLLEALRHYTSARPRAWSIRAESNIDIEHERQPVLCFKVSSNRVDVAFATDTLPSVHLAFGALLKCLRKQSLVEDSVASAKFQLRTYEGAEAECEPISDAFGLGAMLETLGFTLPKNVDDDWCELGKSLRMGDMNTDGGIYKFVDY